MLEITIEGLNQRQRALADMIWACEHKSQIDALIKALPTVQLQDEAKVIVDLMIMATVEQCYDGLGDMEAASTAITKARKG